MTKSLLDRIAVGDRRTVAGVDSVVRAARTPEATAALVAGLSDERAGVRMRSADALEKLSAHDPTRLQPFRRELWRALTRSPQIEVTWNLISATARLRWSPAAAARVFRFLDQRLAERSSRIVCVMALQAMVELARAHPSLRTTTAFRLQEGLSSPFPSVRARARRLVRERQTGGLK